nr:PREDICTED: proline-rich extensin-like protein EPR1 [Bemisia tabaci]
MDYSTILIFLVAGLLVQVSSAPAADSAEAGLEEEYSDVADAENDAASNPESEGSDGAGADGREGRILGPRLISHVQAENNLSPQPHAVGNKFSQPRPASGDVLPSVPIILPPAQDPVNVYPVQYPGVQPVVAHLDKNAGAPVSGVVAGYPLVVHIPETNQPIAIYRGQFPAFIERIVQRIQNRYSVYNPPEYFENRPLPDAELQPPEPPLCVQAADTEGRNETQEGYAYVPPCPTSTTPTTTTPEPPTTGYVYEDPKLPEDNTNITVFNGTIILINCTDLHDLTSTSTEIYVTPPKATSSPPPPPPSIYLPPSTEPSPFYLPPETTTTTTTTTTTSAPPETQKPSTPGPAYLPPETPKPSTLLPPTYLPPESPKPPTYIPPDPAPIYLPPEHPAPSYPPPKTTTESSVAYVIHTEKEPVSYPAPHVNININGYQQANQLQPLFPFPLRLIQFKKMLLAKILHLN